MTKIKQCGAGCYPLSGREMFFRPVLGCLTLMALLFVTRFDIAADVEQQPAEPLVLEVFVREGCPHCAEAKEFLSVLAQLSKL